ncbi:1,2-phenylacetyl-CoA epoxidase subunit PaaD [Streptomyces sp. NPDC003077]|uniref:1,2-phenylacetyl-CoA epoxidase subunit PaaD n=1 Tax=Streptomyces sp. NPDC003077 TaxID=3154443 RepID=UPI0033A79764
MSAPEASDTPGAGSQGGVTGDVRLREVLAAVRDPEIRVLSIEELGILRAARVAPDGAAHVTITPTYVGCPAMDAIRADIRTAVRDAGYPGVRIDTVWSPAWTTGWIGDAARAKLRAAGIAPPGGAHRPTGTAPPEGARLLPLAVDRPGCPRCGAADTTELTRFGSTACKALWRCRACGEPFDHFKEHG